MKRKVLLLSSLVLSSSVFACSDIFINKNDHHVEGRTLDFLVNVATEEYIGFIGQTNTTDIILNSNKIPKSQLTSWKNKYGFLGMQAFNGGNIIDGMNTKGLSFSALYLQGTKYPAYDASDKRLVIGVYDLGNYILSQTSSVNEALKLIKQHQIIDSAISAGDGKYIRNLPLHYVIRDKTGHSAVIEFIDGKMKIYQNAGDTLTNGPTYDWQMNNLKTYSYLSSHPKGKNKNAEKQVHNYDTVYKNSLPSNAGLLGMPGDYTSPSRFVRGSTLLDVYKLPRSDTDALQQAMAVIDSLKVPHYEDDATIWASLKDLDKEVYYFKPYGYFQGKDKFISLGLTNIQTYDLKSIDFNDVPDEYKGYVLHPTKQSDIKEIISADKIPGFS